MYFWHIPILDPLFSLLFTSYILYNVIRNFGQTIRIFLQGKPDNINLPEFENKLVEIQGLKSVHDLHIWSMDGAYFVMGLHMVVKDNATSSEITNIKSQIRRISQQNYVQHSTIEVEFENETCELEKC